MNNEKKCLSLESIYEKYKHLDEDIENDPKIILETFNASKQMDLICDMWQAIKSALPSKEMTQPRPLTDKELAKMQYDATVGDESKGMVEKESLVDKFGHLAPEVSKEDIKEYLEEDAPKEGSSTNELNELFLEKACHVSGVPSRGTSDKWLIDKKDWNDIVAKLSAKPELKKLDGYELAKTMGSWAGSGEDYSCLMDDICSKFGSHKPTIPSVEEIELVLDKHMSYCPDLNKIAQAIHQMLSKEMK